MERQAGNINIGGFSSGGNYDITHLTQIEDIMDFNTYNFVSFNTELDPLSGNILSFTGISRGGRLYGEGWAYISNTLKYIVYSIQSISKNSYGLYSASITGWNVSDSHAYKTTSWALVKCHGIKIS